MRNREHSSSLPSPKGWRKIGKAKIGVALGAAVIGAGVLIPTSPAYASDSNCQTLNLIKACIYITGSGDHISSIVGKAYNTYVLTEDNIHTELVYPNGSLIANSATVNIPEDQWGAEVDTYFNYNNNEPTGNYCAIIWQRNSSGGYDELSVACAPVS